MNLSNALAGFSRDLPRNLISGARLVFFLPVRAADFRASAAQCAILFATSFVFWLAGGVLRGGFPGSIDLDAFKIGLAQIPLILAACLVAAHWQRQPTLFASFAVALAATGTVFEVVATLIYFAGDFDVLASRETLIDAAAIVWSFLIVARVQIVFGGWRGFTPVLALALFAAMQSALTWAIPRTELWAPLPDDIEARLPRITQEELFHRQGQLLDERLASLLPERRGIEDLYFVGVAADAGQDTFASELTTVGKLMDDRFDTAGRSVALVNHPATLATVPLASVSNLRTTLMQLGETINIEEDVVFLHIATHGGPQPLLQFDLPPLELRQLTPTALARMFADSGIKWKVIVISACYSGGFIEALKDEHTLVITASDATHTSFGCSDDSDITWFSEAYYDEALRHTLSFTGAFEAARRTIAVREKAEGYEPSNPQMFVGAAMREKLAGIERRLAVQRMRDSNVSASDSSIVVVNGR